ncbi:MAG: Cof-type HAD-IIB family hydrolase [Eubacterium sp.]|nr:Cof-type HAD-IIB family hydrolase [Eubacterium sp.]
MKKAAFFDIDGTILDAKNYIPKSTIEGIHKMQEKGNYAFLCTGRSRAFVQNKALLDIGFDGIISGCGTMVEFHDEVIFYQAIAWDLLQKTVAFLKEQKAAVIMEGRTHLFLDEEDFGSDLYIARLRDEIGEHLIPITGSEEQWEVSKFSCATEHADLELLKKELEADYELLVHDIPVVEIVPKGCSKGTGILTVCEKLGLPAADTYAFGDSVNDLPMFAAAGHSIAMGNAPAFVQREASYVTDSLHDDGIYHALEHFGLI